MRRRRRVRAVATKWDGAALIPTFAFLAFIWTIGAKRAIGVQKPFMSTLRRDLVPTGAWMVIVSIGVYIASWTGWFLNGPKYAYDREWAKGRHSDWSFIPESVRSLWHYHWEIYEVPQAPELVPLLPRERVGLALRRAPGALLRGLPAPAGVGLPHRRPRLRTDDLRPRNARRSGGRRSRSCASWSTSSASATGAAPRSCVPFLILYLPWLLQFKRTMFFFYALPLLPFISIALAVTIGYLIGPATATFARRRSRHDRRGDVRPHRGGRCSSTSGRSSAPERCPFVGGWVDRMWFHSWIEDKGS